MDWKQKSTIVKLSQSQEASVPVPLSRGSYSQILEAIFSGFTFTLQYSVLTAISRLFTLRYFPLASWVEFAKSGIILQFQCYLISI